MTTKKELLNKLLEDSGLFELAIGRDRYFSWVDSSSQTPIYPHIQSSVVSKMVTSKELSDSVNRLTRHVQELKDKLEKNSIELPTSSRDFFDSEEWSTTRPSAGHLPKKRYLQSSLRSELSTLVTQWLELSDENKDHFDSLTRLQVDKHGLNNDRTDIQESGWSQQYT